MLDSLAAISRAIPLPRGWSPPELFSLTRTIGGMPIFLIGLESRHTSGQTITGSAGGFLPEQVERAYFELLERACIVEASLHLERPVVVDERGAVLGVIPIKQVFLESPEPERWAFSRSNGVALNCTAERARESALFELLERDAVLRSWYGYTLPRRVALLSTSFSSEQLAGLGAHYEVSAYEFDCYAPPAALLDTTAFPHSSGPQASGPQASGPQASGPQASGPILASVAGVFALPKHEGCAPAYGFAARQSASEAQAAAGAECIQRLGFLWGEPIDPEPAFSPTPAYHQEFFLSHSRLHLIAEWLAGEHRQCQSSATGSGRLSPALVTAGSTVEAPACEGNEFYRGADRLGFDGPVFDGPALDSAVFEGPIFNAPISGGPISGGPISGGPISGGPAFKHAAVSVPGSHGPWFVDLTPEHLRDRVSVAKALLRGALPLVFGSVPLFARGQRAEGAARRLAIHPIA